MLPKAAWVPLSASAVRKRATASSGLAQYEVYDNLEECVVESYDYQRNARRDARSRNAEAATELSAVAEHDSTSDLKSVEVGDIREGTGELKVRVRVNGIDGRGAWCTLTRSGTEKYISLVTLRSAYRLVERSSIEEPKVR